MKPPVVCTNRVVIAIRWEDKEPLCSAVQSLRSGLANAEDWLAHGREAPGPLCELSPGVSDLANLVKALEPIARSTRPEQFSWSPEVRDGVLQLSPTVANRRWAELLTQKCLTATSDATPRPLRRKESHLASAWDSTVTLAPLSSALAKAGGRSDEAGILRFVSKRIAALDEHPMVAAGLTVSLVNTETTTATIGTPAATVVDLIRLDFEQAVASRSTEASLLEMASARIRRPHLSVTKMVRGAFEAHFLDHAVAKAIQWLKRRLALSSLPASRQGWQNLMKSFSIVRLVLDTEPLMTKFLENGFLTRTTLKIPGGEKVKVLVYKGAKKPDGTPRGPYRRKVITGELDHALRPDEELKTYPGTLSAPAFEVNPKKLGAKFESPIPPVLFGDTEAYQTKVRRCVKHYLLACKAPRSSTGTIKLPEKQMLALLRDASQMRVLVPSEDVVNRLVALGVLVQDNNNNGNPRMSVSPAVCLRTMYTVVPVKGVAPVERQVPLSSATAPPPPQQGRGGRGRGRGRGGH